MSIRGSLVVLLLLAAHSLAGPNSLANDEMNVVEPQGMNDRAVFKPGRIPWCTGKYTLDVWDKGRLKRAVASGYSSMGGTWMDGVEHLCQWADDPTWQKQAMYVVQQVMNANNISQDDAVEKVKEFLAKYKAERENEGKPKSDEDRFAFSEHSIKVVEAEPGIARASIGAQPAWCDKAKTGERWDPGRIGRTFDSRYGIQSTVEAALHICQRPTDKTWKLMAGYILQRWMNWTKLPQAEAEAALRARIQIAKFQAEHDALCKKLEVNAELGGEAKAYGEAHLTFFACGNTASNNPLGQPLWQDEGAISDVGFYLDADDKLESEIVRLHWLYDQTEELDSEKLPSKDAFDNTALLRYAVASVDFGKIDDAALSKMLATAPFNNDYARTIIAESTAKLKWRRKMYDQAIDKLGKQGAEYLTVLRDAPKKGFAEWDKVSAPWKAELERSRAFERKLGDPSRKGLAGCTKELMPDVKKLIKSYKASEYNDLVNKLSSDPIAALLLSRFSVCLAVEKVAGAGAFKDVSKSGRDLRGPRSMAYYAMVDALTAALKDRPKMVIAMTNFHFRMNVLTEVYRDFDYPGSAPRDPEKTMDKGFVKATKKVGDGLEITFKTQTVKYPEYHCVPTNRPIRILSDGRIEYEHNCRATGKMLTQDKTPRPITVSPVLAEGVKAGAYVVGNGNVVVYVKKKADDTKIQTFFGFPL